MIIETIASNGNKAHIDDNSIMVINEAGNGCTHLLLYGNEVTIQMPFKQVEKIFREAKLRDKFTSEPPAKTEQKKFPIIEVGDHKFQIDIRTSEFKDGITSTLLIYANFPVKNDALRTFVEYVNGVEKYCDFSYNKYDGYISIGKLFDVETIRNQVEQKVKEYLEQ